MIARMRDQLTDADLVEYVVMVDDAEGVACIEQIVNEALERALYRGGNLGLSIKVEDETTDHFRIWRFVGQVGFIDDFGLKLFVQLTEHFDGPITVDRNPCSYRWHG